MPNRYLIIGCVMMSSVIVAIEATIIATAMPLIVGQLGGLTLYSWVFSVYLLTQTATTVVFGRLADLYGRRPIILVGIATFLAGSLLCGLSGSMPMLVAARAIQGIGAGAILPLMQTIVGDLFSASERGKVQGLLSSVWGVSAVIGPLVGGIVLDHLSWHWIFWINIPFGLLAMVGFLAFLRETGTRRATRIGVAEPLLFTLAVAAVMVVLTEGHEGVSTLVGVAAAIAFVAGALFVWYARRAAAPMISLALWVRRPVAVATAAAFFAGVSLIGLTTFLPIYGQGVLGRTPIVAGLILGASVVGWPLATVLASRLFGPFGLRRVYIVGTLLLPLGGLALFTLGPASPIWVAALGSFLVGMGQGFSNTVGIIIVQEIVGWSERGAATAAVIFARNLGSTLGATVLGTVFNAGLASLHLAGGPIHSDDVSRLLDHAGTGNEALRLGLAGAVQLVFLGILVTSLATALAAAYMPTIRLKQQSVDARAAAE